MPLMMPPHLSASRRMRAESSSGVDDATSTAMSSMRFFTSGRNSARAISPLSLRHDLLRHTGRAERAVPHRHLVARHGLGDRRHVGQERRALLFGDGEQLQPPGLHVLEALRAGGEEEMHLPAHRVGDRGRAAAIGHVHHLDAGHLLQHRGAEMIGRAGPRRRIDDLAGICLRVGDELRHGVRRHRRMHHHRVGHIGEQRERGKILHAVERHGGEQSVVHGVHAHGVEQDGVAVRRGACDRAGADVAGGAGAVLDHDRLAHRLVQMLRRRRAPGCRSIRRPPMARSARSGGSDRFARRRVRRRGSQARRAR